MDHNHPLKLRSKCLVAAFRRYLQCFVWLRFSAVRISHATTPASHTGMPLVIYTNHPSWWDPAIFALVGPVLFGQRASFGPMEAGQLQRWRFFRRLGVFGLEPGFRGAANFLRVAKQGLAERDTILWITAEGAFADVRRRPLELQAGVAHLARDIPGVILIPLALDYVFWNESRPEVLLRFGEKLIGGPGSIADWTGRLSAALTAAMDALADDSASRDPSRFATILPGVTQTGLLFRETRPTTA